MPLRSPLQILLVPCAVAGLSLASAACSRNEETVRAASGEDAVGYPPGFYRQQQEALLGVAQSLSHIVIAHGSSTATPTVLDHPMWLPLAKARRTPAEAKALAVAISRRARSGKEDFASLARQYSDDRATAALGGALGVVPAFDLPEAYLDALWELRQGAASRVIETFAGFHVIKRMPVPSGEVSFAMLVVKHDDASGSWQPGRKTARSREQAEALARAAAAKAEADPTTFPQLVEQYGDEFGVNPAGDRGRWSRAEVAFDPRVLHAAGTLTIGSVSDVLDTPVGFAVIKRLPLGPAIHVAASAIAISYEAAEHDVLPATRTKAEAAALAQSVLQTLAKHPERFEALREEHCPDAELCMTRAWPKGRGDFGLDRMVDGLAEGQIAPAALDAPPGFMILRREPIGRNAPADPKLSYVLPEVKPLAVDDLLHKLPPEELAMGFVAFCESAADKLKLETRERTDFLEIGQNVARGLAHHDAAEREQALASGRAEFAALLGPERTAALRAHRNQWLLDWQTFK